MGGELGTARMREIVVAIVLSVVVSLAPTALASQTDKRLDAIFERLNSTDSKAEAAELTNLVWAIWHESDNEVVNSYMAKGIEEMSQRNFENAIDSFSKVVEVDPNFAEGWNKRATVYYLMGEFEASIRDVDQTLALEPRHFGALSGLGQIYLALGEGWEALKAFEGAIRVNPHLVGPQAHVKELRQYLRGKPI
jgi:tetratricopeptide (TPR) repeat protein